MALPSLALLSPYLANATDTLSVSSSVLPLTIRADSSIVLLLVTMGGETKSFSSYVVQSGYNVFSVLLTIPVATSPSVISIVGQDSSLLPQLSPALTIAYLYAQGANLPVIDPPSGVSIYRGLNTCKVEWVKPDQLQTPSLNLLGVRVLYSSDPTGVTTPYQQFGAALISDVSRTGQNVVSSSTSSTGPVNDAIPLATGTLAFHNSNQITRSEGDWITDGASIGSQIMLSKFSISNINNNKTFTIAGVFDLTIQTEEFVGDFPADQGTVLLREVTSTITSTITEDVYPINYSNVTFQASTPTNSNFQFYVVLSSIVQNIADNSIYESSFAGPFTCGFVDLRQVKPTDFPYVQQKESIASRLINATTLDYPDLDLSPRSELRDVLIDPVALEISNQSIREWFGRLSTSISALATFDDYNGDGFSDSLNESPYKPLVASAWNLSANDLQTFVDKQFDVLGERAGLTRGSATSAITQVTFYTYIKPTASVTVMANTQVGTLGDSDSSALVFTCRGTQTIDTTNLNSIYDASNGWWAVTLPCECQTTGTKGNVGAGAIVSSISGVPNNWLVTNQAPGNFGTDGETNAKYAARIKNSLVVGKDSGRRLGYWNTAITTPGVVDVTVVASGDPEMLRDWFPQGNRHLYGCVDIYVRGTQESVETQLIPYATISNSSSVSFNKTNTSSYSFSSSSLLPLTNVIGLYASSLSGTVYFGVTRALTEGIGFTLDPNEFTYTLDNNEKVYGPTNGVFLSSLLTANPNLNGIYFFSTFKIASPLQYTPSSQPATDIYFISGASTGVLSESYYRLIVKDDPLLTGFSNVAKNLVQVDGTNSITTATPVIVIFATEPYVIGGDYMVSGDTQLLGAGITLSSGDVVSVLSSDLSMVYKLNTDYIIVGIPPFGTGYRYSSYAIKRLATGAIGPMDSVLVTFNKYVLSENCTQYVESVNVTTNTSTPTKLAQSGIIQDTRVIDSYGYPPSGYTGYQNTSGPFPASSCTVGSTYTIASLGSLGSLTDFTLIGAASNTIGLSFVAVSATGGFSGNAGATGTGSVNAPVLWSQDPDLADEDYASRFIKVTWTSPISSTPVVLVLNKDFVLTIDSVTKQTSITLLPTGVVLQVLNSSYTSTTLTVTYFCNEMFSIISSYPGYVSQVANSVDLMRHAAADVIVKSVVVNPVDISMTVTLVPNASVQSVDNSIRTALGVTLDNAKGVLYQSQLVYQIQSLAGVASVQLPILKLAKGNGAYIVGQLLPAGTNWTPIAPLFSNLTFNPTYSFITSSSVLTDNTKPSGGLPDAFAGFLYEGDSYTRCSSLAELASKSNALHSNLTTTAGNFYIFGEADPADPEGLYAGCVAVDFSTLFVTSSAYQPFSPAYFPFRVTYEVWNETGTKDITMSSTEYLTSGDITIDYITPQA